MGIAPPPSPWLFIPEPLQLPGLPSLALPLTLHPCIISAYFPALSLALLFLKPPSPGFYPFPNPSMSLNSAGPQRVSPHVLKHTEYVGPLIDGMSFPSPRKRALLTEYPFCNTHSIRIQVLIFWIAFQLR